MVIWGLYWKYYTIFRKIGIYMINEKWNKADLRITSKELSSMEIGRILSQDASISGEKGKLMNPQNPRSFIMAKKNESG